MLNFKLIISKSLFLFIFTLTMSSNVFGFDLKTSRRFKSVKRTTKFWR